MKIPLMTLFSLALTLYVLTPLQDARAIGLSFKTQCVRLKAGKLVKSGECTAFEGSNVHGSVYSAAFVDNDKLSMSGSCGSYPFGTGDPQLDLDTEKTLPCEYTLDDRPAVQQSLMGNGWTCYQKLGTDEVMCASEKSMCTELDPGCLDESGSTPATPQRLHLTNAQHLQFMKSSAAYRAADERLTAAWKQVKNRLSPKRFQVALAEQRAWVKTGRNDAASRLSGGLSPVEAFTQVTEERAWELERLAAREGR